MTGELTQGHRAASVFSLFDGPAGGYCIILSADTGKKVLWAKTPAGQVGRCEDHDVVVHDDGTVSVSPSILMTTGGTVWHGHLKRGIWREV